jgi:pyridoxine kinase
MLTSFTHIILPLLIDIGIILSYSFFIVKFRMVTDMSNLKVCAVHDLSCMGRSSLAVIMPVLSAMGIQCCPLPTAVFSAHLYGYGEVASHDLTCLMPGILEHWKREGISFSAVYTGFLGSAGQIEHVSRCIRLFGEGIVLVDPVMGDEGRVYSTYTPEMCDKMRLLASQATLITPNLTEAAILLGKDPSRLPRDYAAIAMWSEALAEAYACDVILTGAELQSGFLSCIYTEKKRGGARVTGLVSKKKLGGYFPGTGDIFASVLLGKLLKNSPLEAAVGEAMNFVSLCIEEALKSNAETREGVPFEGVLKHLY